MKQLNMKTFKTILDTEKAKYKQDNNNQKPKDTGLKLFNPFETRNLRNFTGVGFSK